MAQETKKTNIIEVIEGHKDIVRRIIGDAWNETKKPGESAVTHFAKFHLTVSESMNNPVFNFTVTLGIVSQALADILTPEEREELRNETTDITEV